MSYPVKLIAITSHGSWGPGDDFQISLVRKDNTYTLRGRRIHRGVGPCNPQITRKTVKVTPEWANTLLGELRSANIPLLPLEASGCDGEFYSMTVGSLYGGATYVWWSYAPDGWEILPKVTNCIIAMFSRNLPE